MNRGIDNGKDLPPDMLTVRDIYPSSIYLSIIYLSIHRPSFSIPSIHSSLYLSNHAFFHLSNNFVCCSSTLYLIVFCYHLSFKLSICLSIYLSIYPSVYQSVYPSIYLSIYLSICLSIHLSIYSLISQKELYENVKREKFKVPGVEEGGGNLAETFFNPEKQGWLTKEGKWNNIFMYVYVCMYVCLYVCMFVCIFVCMYVCM